MGIIAVFLPPLAVLVRAGCGAYFLIDILLCFLGWIPAILFAWFVIVDTPNARQRHARAKDGDIYEGRRRSDSQHRYHHHHHHPRHSYDSRRDMMYEPEPRSRYNDPYYGRSNGHVPGPGYRKY